MKKIVLMFAFATMLISATTAQEWTIDFHYADKFWGLPNRYDCTYIDADSLFKIELRSDLSFVEITSLQGDFKQYSDSVQVILYEKNGETNDKHIMITGYFYEANIMRLKCWNIVNYLMKGNAVDIILYENDMERRIKIFPIMQNDLIA